MFCNHKRFCQLVIDTALRNLKLELEILAVDFIKQSHISSLTYVQRKGEVKPTQWNGNVMWKASLTTPAATNYREFLYSQKRYKNVKLEKSGTAINFFALCPVIYLPDEGRVNEPSILRRPLTPI